MSAEAGGSCCCSTAPKVVFACSGAADVGAIADQAARQLARDGVGKMFCLAGIGGRVSGIMKSTESAAAIVAIDGCALNCAKKTLEQAGFTSFHHLELGKLGFPKGQSPVNEAAVTAVVAKVTEVLE